MRAPKPMRDAELQIETFKWYLLGHHHRKDNLN
jgi:hypothetical protein